MATPPSAVRACGACLSRGFRISAFNPSRAKKRKLKEARDDALRRAAEAGNAGAIEHLKRRQREELEAQSCGDNTPKNVNNDVKTANNSNLQSSQNAPRCDNGGSVTSSLTKRQPENREEVRQWLAQSLSVCKQCNGLGVTVGIRNKPLPESVPEYAPVNAPRVVIVGGGIGGCALALALQQREIPCTVYERDPSFGSRAQGYALTMQQASNTLRRLGFRDLVNLGAMPVSHASLLPNGTIVNEYGRKCHSTTCSTLSNGKPPDKQRFNIQLPRETVRQMLYDALEPGTVKWGSCFRSYEATGKAAINTSGPASCETDMDKDQNEQNVVMADAKCAESASAPLKVTFENVSQGGKEFTVDADLVVGCDGIWSKVRQQKMGTEEPRYLGLIVILGRAPCSHLLTDDKMFQTLGGETRIYTMPFTKGVTMWQLSFPMPLEEAKALSAAGPVALLQEAQRRCSSWHDPVPDLLLNTQACDVTGYPAYDRAPPEVDADTAFIPCLDPNRRVTLLGDAVHPMSPFKGQGANQALMDAMSLASLLASVKPLEQAIRVFETEMTDRVREKVEKSAEAAEILHSSRAVQERASRLVT